MKIEITTGSRVINSAWFYVTDHALNVIINTWDRYVFPECVSIGSDYVCWMFDNEADNSWDEVKVIAETENEKKLINGIIFESHCKDQFHYLLPKRYVTERNKKKCLNTF